MINAYFYGASLASSTGLEMCGGDHLVGSIWKVLDFHISIRYACKCKRANGQKMGNVPINFFLIVQSENDRNIQKEKI